MKKYTMHSTKVQRTIVVVAYKRLDAIAKARQELNLTWQDSIICLGINL